MSVIKKAIPTEYKGVPFDSKSEAVFARCLDLCGIDWEERHPISHEGHDWDFLVWLKHLEIFTSRPSSQTFCTYHRPSVRPLLIELKPSCPTKTYVHRLRNTTQNDVSGVVIYGSPYEEPLNHWFGKIVYQFFEIRTGVASSHLPLSMLDDDLGKIEHVVSEAKNYRFDLA